MDEMSEAYPDGTEPQHIMQDAMAHLNEYDDVEEVVVILSGRKGRSSNYKYFTYGREHAQLGLIESMKHLILEGENGK